MPTPHEGLVFEYLNNLMKLDQMGCSYPPKPVVLDVGAYQADMFFDMVRRLKLPNAYRYIGVEPEPQLYVSCCERLAPWRDQATIHRCAITGNTGVGTLYSAFRDEDKPSQSTTMVKRSLKWKRQQRKVIKIERHEVRTLSLDSFFDDYLPYSAYPKIHLMKVNCEGGEYGMFTFDCTALQRVWALWICFHNHTKPFNGYAAQREKIYSILEGKGFVLDAGKLEGKKHLWQLWINHS